MSTEMRNIFYVRQGGGDENVAFTYFGQHHGRFLKRLGLYLLETSLGQLIFFGRHCFGGARIKLWRLLTCLSCLLDILNLRSLAWLSRRSGDFRCFCCTSRRLLCVWKRFLQEEMQISTEATTSGQRGKIATLPQQLS